jgi:hypothetical protein
LNSSFARIDASGWDADRAYDSTIPIHVASGRMSGKIASRSGMVGHVDGFPLQRKPAQPAALLAPEQLVRRAESSDADDSKIRRIERQAALAATNLPSGCIALHVARFIVHRGS